jgi:thymidylate synthase (FAD)
MRICFTDVELLPDNGLLKNIELAGRVCYKSEDKITDTSAKSFVEMIRGRNHLSVLEHGSIYLVVPKENPLPLCKTPWCHIVEKDGKIYYYTNFRYICVTTPDLADIILKDDPLPEGIEFFTPTKEDPYRRWSFRIITNFKISEQYVRHRVFSHSKESSRYCNYAKDRFNNEISIVVPVGSDGWFGSATGTIEGIDDKWYFTPDDTKSNKGRRDTLASCFPVDEKGRFILTLLEEAPVLNKILSRCKLAELDYLEEIQNGSKPEFARDFLTLFTKTEQVMTGFAIDWKDLIQKRSVPGVQKESMYIATRIKKALIRAISGSSVKKDRNGFDSLYCDLPIGRDDIAPEPRPMRMVANPGEVFQRGLDEIMGERARAWQDLAIGVHNRRQ